jgi:hypothetical protein
MSISAKFYNRILLNRIRDPIDKLLRKNQAGFRTGRSCVQQIHIIRRIMDGAYSEGKPLFLTFVDFKKAFDSIDMDMMFAIPTSLRHLGKNRRNNTGSLRSLNLTSLRGWAILSTLRHNNGCFTRRRLGPYAIHNSHRLCNQTISK